MRYHRPSTLALGLAILEAEAGSDFGSDTGRTHSHNQDADFCALEESGFYLDASPDSGPDSNPVAFPFKRH